MKPRVLQLYYLATPLFLAVEYRWNVSIRVPLPEQALLRYAYYGFCLACGVACFWKPRAAPLVALFESSLNIILLVLSVMAAVFALPGTIMDAGRSIPSALTPGGMLNFCLSGAVWLFSFYLYQAELLLMRRRYASAGFGIVEGRRDRLAFCIRFLLSGEDDGKARD